MARFISSSSSRLPLAWTCRRFASSAQSPPSANAGLADLESTPLETYTKPDESVIQSFNDRRRAAKDQYLPGNR